MPVEQYKSSAVLDNPISDSNTELRRMTAYFVLKPYFLGMAWGARDTEVLKDRHSAGRSRPLFGHGLHRRFLAAFEKRLKRSRNLWIAEF